MYPARFGSVKFSLIQTAAATSDIEVESRDLLKNNKLNDKGPYSARMGTTGSEYRCQTCFNTKLRCVGHEGVINNPYPVNSPTAANDFKRWIKVICLSCGNPLLPDSFFEGIPMRDRMARALKQVKAKSVSAKYCAHCGEMYPKIERDAKNQNVLKVVQDKNTYLLLPGVIEQIFARVSNATVLRLGRPLTSKPSNFVTRHIIVAPPHTRPEVIKMGSNTKSTTDEHTSMYQLLIDKKPDLFVASNDINEIKQSKLLAYDNIYANLIKGKENSSIASRFMGKGGLLRQNMMGKRIRGCCRSVISNSVGYEIDSLGIPISFAKTIQMCDIVQEYNKDILMKYVRNGITGYPGATAIIRNGKQYTTSDNFVLMNGDMVLRDVIDDDPAPFCRQPSLTISNISSHHSRIMMNPNLRSFQMNGIVCPLYNADFDGDEMNLFWLKTYAGRNEAQKLQPVKNWVISHATSDPIIGQMEDSILGLAKLTKSGVKLDKYHAGCLFAKTSFMPDLSKYNDNDISGHEIISILLRETPVNFSRNTAWFVEAFQQWIKFDENDKRVEIEHGVMRRGILDQASIGKKVSGGLYHVIFAEYGEAKMLEVMYNMQQVGVSYLSMCCSSVGLIDMLLPKATRDEIDRLSGDLVNKANEVTNKLERGDIIPPIGETVESFYEKQQLETLTAPDLFYPAVLTSIDIEANGLYAMIGLKSKGKIDDMIGMICAVGQRSINGKRIAQNFGYKRTLPYSPRYDTDPYNRGYIGQPYIEGISKKAYIFGAEQVRFDLIVKALSTSVTGDQNRQSIKNLESIIINCFRWVTKNRAIIQFAYGDDYVDPRRLIKVKIPTIKISDEEMKTRYFHADYPDYFEAMMRDRARYREAFLKIESINVRELIGDERRLPVDIERTLRAILAEYGNDVPKGDANLGKMVAIVEEFIRDLPYVMMNDSARRRKLNIPSFVQKSTFIFAMLLRIVFCPNALIQHKLNTTILSIILNRIFIMYLDSLIDPGTAAGNIAAQSFSEPFTQYMLDAHKRSSTGGTSKASMNTVKEVFGARPVSKLSAPMMVLPVRPDLAGDRAQVQRIANNIEMMNFLRFVSAHQLFLEQFGEPTHPQYINEKQMIAKFQQSNPLLKPPEDLVRRCLRIVINMTNLILKNMSLELIVRKLYENFPNIYIVYTPENAGNIIMRIYFRAAMFKGHVDLPELRKTRSQILSCMIRGIEGIKNTEVIKMVRSQINNDGSITQNLNCWGIRTAGTNLAEMLLFPELDHVNIQTSAVKEVEQIMGISAARHNIVISLKNIGMDCSIRHLLIYADEMTYPGIVTSIERNGLKMREPKNTLLHMGFGSPISTLEEAALNGTVDELHGATSSFLVGTVPKLGTKFSQVCYNEEFVIKNMKSPEDILAALR